MTRGDIYILVGCEESQAICIALRERGFSAFSCDLKECSGGHPEWHIKGDVFRAIHDHFIYTQSGERVNVNKWHAAIFHPECTYMTVSGLFRNKNNPERAEKTEKSLQFVCDLLNCGILHIGLENPVGCISTRVFKYIGWFGDEKPVYKVFPKNIVHGGFKPTQIIQPYEFGDDASKSTCLWTINLPALKLKAADYYPPRITKEGKKRWGNQTDSGQNKLPPDGKNNKGHRATLRSKTYPGIANAIAEQWGNYILQHAG